MDIKNGRDKMSYTNVYPSRINWENEPSINTPLNAVNLNKIDYAVYEHDRTFATWDTTKANQSDLLLSVKSIDYDTETGVFVFTWQNGTTKTVDLNIEKIPVSFSMDANGVITMTTDDGTQYTADVGALIKTYTFTDSSVIDFTVTTDQSGNKTVTADIVDGSITGDKLQPNYLADCQEAKTGAETAQGLSEDSAEDAEAWAVGQRNGVDVPSTDPAYENSAKYWANHTSASLVGLNDVNVTSPTDKQGLVYDAATGKWINADIIDTEAIHWSEASRSVKKNFLLPNNAISQTINGVTFTVNSDGSVTVNGTATNDVYFNVSNNVVIPKGNYKLNGCPSGGSISTYNIYCEGTGVTVARDTGEGADYNFDSEKTIRCYITIVNGTTVDNIIFYPMLRLASIEDDTYEPYIPDNVELDESKADKTQISNPNLLDNPWFTINQRGASSYGGGGYTVDRWKINSGSLVLNNNGVTFTANAQYTTLEQFLPSDIFEEGKEYTISYKKTDGTYYAKTFTYANSESFAIIWDNDISGWYSTYRTINGVVELIVLDSRDPAETSLSIRAVKLEVGSVSTLAQDTAPNYATELLKCQRYFQVFADNNIRAIGVGQATSATNVSIYANMPVKMRTTPSLIFSGVLSLRNGNTNITATAAIDIIGESNILFRMTTAGATVGACYECYSYNSGVLQLTADL